MSRTPQNYNVRARPYDNREWVAVENEINCDDSKKRNDLIEKEVLAQKMYGQMCLSLR